MNLWKTIQIILTPSDYPKDHPLYSDKNKKVIGKFKDELNSIKMLEYIELRSKMYSYRTESKPRKINLK